VKNYHEFVRCVLECYPFEAVGFVVDGMFIPCRNMSWEPLDAFELRPADVAQYLDACDYLVHSHTVKACNYPRHQGIAVDPRTPSKADMEGQLAMDKPWAVVSCDGVSVSEPVMWGDPHNRPPLSEREFVFNAQDCLSLTTDYLFQTHGIELPECPRDWDWAQRGERHIDQLWPEWGFIEVPISEAREGDLILFQMGTDYTNHMGIYLGGDKLLHHMLGRLSCVDSAARWHKFIHKIVRHRDIK
jgi:proteasome lid subunit RPN8/RPN11